jgi:protein tyrosine phosphatase (PTP) superfamily phosphohydrolase (DUF442 family)
LFDLLFCFPCGTHRASVPQTIAKIVPLTEELFIGSQPSTSQLSNLSQIGVKSVLNIRHPREPNFVNEKHMLQEQGIKYANVPLLEASDMDEQFMSDVKVGENMERNSGNNKKKTRGNMKN